MATSTADPVSSSIARLLRRTAGPRNLTLYHRVGKLVDQAKDRGYGRSFFVQIATRLQADGVAGMGEETLYKCHRLFRTVSANDLSHLAKLGVSFRVASNLGTSNLSDADRRSLMRRLGRGVFGRNQLNRSKLAAEFKQALGSRAIATNPRSLIATKHVWRVALSRIKVVLEQPQNADAHRQVLNLARQSRDRLAKLIRAHG